MSNPEAQRVRDRFVGWSDEEIIVELNRRLAAAHRSANCRKEWVVSADTIRVYADNEEAAKDTAAWWLRIPKELLSASPHRTPTVPKEGS